MIVSERERYHQLHPAKLLVDWSTAALAGALLWWHRPWAALLLGFVPSIAITSVFLSGRLDHMLDATRRGPLAQAIAPQLSADINALRFTGLAMSWAGCWFHQAWLVPAGVLVIAGAWWLARRRGVARWARDAGH